jgi:hypothetical protein
MDITTQTLVLFIAAVRVEISRSNQLVLHKKKLRRRKKDGFIEFSVPGIAGNVDPPDG